MDPRWIRIGLACAALLSAAAGRAIGQEATAPAEMVASYRDEYLGFAELLTRYRQGEDAVLPSLRAAGARFAAHHGRQDAPRVVDYYAGLDAEQRAEGWRAYEAFSVLWGRVAQATLEVWPEEREDVLAELRRFIASTLPRADYVPAGRGLSLCARIEIQELESRGELTGARRESLIERARADARQALAIFERAGQQTPRLESLWILGRLEFLEQRPHAAQLWFAECAELSLLVRSDAWRENALIGQVHVARSVGDVLRIDMLLKELAEFRDPRECWALAHEHARRLIDEDAATAAVAFLERVRPEGEAALIEWRRDIGLARLRAGDIAGARRDMEPLADVEHGHETRLALATLALAEDRPEAVLTEFGAAAARAELPVYERMYALSLAGEAALRQGRAVEARALLGEAIELAEGMEQRLGSLEGGTASVFGERMGLHTIVLAAEAELGSGRALEAATLIERSQSRALGGARWEADDLRAWASEYELGLLTFVCGADAGLAIHVAPDGEVHAHAIAHGRRALSEGARRMREAALANDEARLAALGAELAVVLIPEELRARLAGAAGGRLSILLHGPIERLPVEQLVIAGAALESLCTPLVLPGLPARRPPAEAWARERDEWWLLGDPRDQGGAPQLAQAAVELDSIAGMRPGASTSAGAGFTIDTARAAIASGRSLHIATHLRRDVRCDGGRLAALGLELDAGELLCAREIFELAQPAPMVVLSACATGEGRFLDAEGLLGLARAFLETGTRNLLVTLWPVRDDAARVFALAFHRALLEGQLPSQATASARIALRAAGYGSADACAFRLIGCD